MRPTIPFFKRIEIYGLRPESRELLAGVGVRKQDVVKAPTLDH